MEFQFEGDGPGLPRIDEKTVAALVETMREIVVPEEGAHTLDRADQLTDDAGLDKDTLQAFAVALGLDATDGFMADRADSPDTTATGLATLILFGIDMGLMYAENHGWVPPNTKQ